MNIHVTIEGEDIIVIKISGHMDLDQIGELDRIFNEYFAQGYRLFVLNMVDVRDISSTGISRILSMFKKLELSRGRLALAELSAVSAYVLELARLDDIFPMYLTQKEAIESFSIKDTPEN